MNPRCEHHEQNLSAIVDGELATVDLLSTLDHALDCPSCARFYRSVRDLEAAVAAEEAPGSSSIPPHHVWDRIAEAVPRAERRSRWLDWAPRLAAAVLLAFGVWLFGALDRPGTETPSAVSSTEASLPDEIEVRIGEADMTEQRFVELTAEVLRADQRYHQKMLEVMETVTSPRFREASGELESSDEGLEGERISIGEDEPSVGVREWRF